jgi:hypothetical protein
VHNRRYLAGPVAPDHRYAAFDQYRHDRLNALSGCADIQPIWASHSPLSLAISAESSKTRALVEKHDVQANSRYGLTLSVPLVKDFP